MELNCVLDYIEQVLGARDHEFCNWAELAQRIPKDQELEGAYVGSYSLTYRNRKRTLVANHHNWCGLPVSAAAVARAILRTGLFLLKRRRILWTSKSLHLLTIPQPLYCRPVAAAQRLTYIDIKGAYYRIYRALPFDLRFQGLRAYGGSLWFSDFLPSDLNDYKICRNSLVGVFRAMQSSRVKAGRIESSANRNPLLSPEHWGFMAHLLHALAQSAIGQGACYYNTDGAIFERDEDAIRWSDYLVGRGFTPELKAQGSGYVASIGHYRIGATTGGCVNPQAISFNNLFTASPYVEERWEQWN